MSALKRQIIFVIGLILLAAYYVSPTIIYFALPKEIRNDQVELEKRIPDWLPQKHIKLGLDLQGGVQLVLGVDTAAAVRNKLGRIGTEITRWSSEGKHGVKTAYVLKNEPILRVEFEDPNLDFGKFKSALSKDFFGLVVQRREGNYADFKYDDNQVATIRQAALGQAERVIRARVDKWGVSEPMISRRADGSILVQLPGFKDPQKARELLGRTAQLRFQMLDEDFDGFKGLLDKLPEGVKAERRGSYNAVSFISEDKQAIIDLTKDVIPEGRQLLFEEEQIAGGKKVRYVSNLVMSAAEVSGEDVLDAFVTTDTSSMDYRPAVSLKFTGVGGKRFADITGTHVGKRMAIVLDDVVVSAPVINTKISGGSAQITMGAGQGYNEVAKEAQDLALILKSGALPAPITIMEERQVGATLGPELANQGVMSVLVGIVFVFGFMLVYYKKPGVIACMALALNGLFLLALMAIFGFSLSLPGFAGFILTLGMAVDANVLINERIREELRDGKNARKAVENGFTKVFWTIVDANVTTLIAAFLLLESNSSGPIKGFALSLILGLIVSLYTALYFSKIMFQFVVSSNKTDKEMREWLGAAAVADGKVFRWNFLHIGKIVTYAGFALIAAVLIVSNTKGVNWAVDFSGGTEMEIAFGKPVEPAEVREVFKQSGIPDITMQSIGNQANQRYLVRFERHDLTPAQEAAKAEGEGAAKSIEESAGLRDMIQTKLADYKPDLQRVDYVGPVVGKELRTQGLMSLIYAILGISVYVVLRFDMRFTPGALVKMVQDGFSVMAYYVFFWRSFDLTAIAALLTVVGYSVNDVIVIYDRIRENFETHAARGISENVNISLNETLSRSLNTSLVTILSLIGILVFGTASIWDFGVAMAVGVVSATTTSTFLASTFIIWLDKWRRKWAARGAGSKPVTTTV
jgi:protein-export membrane protein SecD/preprotein translocase SecF subunit